jgi:miniconductance mechanosensitive channel
MKNNWFVLLLQKLELPPTIVELLANMLTFLAVVLAATLVTLIVRKTLLKFLTTWIQKNNYRWDDPLAGNQLLTKISWFVPVTIFSLAVDMFLDPGTTSYLPAKRLVSAGFVIVSVLSLTALLS